MKVMYMNIMRTVVTATVLNFSFVILSEIITGTDPINFIGKTKLTHLKTFKYVGTTENVIYMQIVKYNKFSQDEMREHCSVKEK